MPVQPPICALGHRTLSGRGQTADDRGPCARPGQPAARSPTGASAVTGPDGQGVVRDRPTALRAATESKRSPTAHTGRPSTPAAPIGVPAPPPGCDAPAGGLGPRPPVTASSARRLPEALGQSAAPPRSPHRPRAFAPRSPGGTPGQPRPLSPPGRGPSLSSGRPRNPQPGLTGGAVGTGGQWGPWAPPRRTSLTWAGDTHHAGAQGAGQTALQGRATAPCLAAPGRGDAEPPTPHCRAASWGLSPPHPLRRCPRPCLASSDPRRPPLATSPFRGLCPVPLGLWPVQVSPQGQPARPRVDSEGPSKDWRLLKGGIPPGDHRAQWTLRSQNPRALGGRSILDSRARPLPAPLARWEGERPGPQELRWSPEQRVDGAHRTLCLQMRVGKAHTVPPGRLSPSPTDRPQARWTHSVCTRWSRKALCRA